MTKKDFAGVNTGRVYDAIEQATSTKGQQGTASPQEAAERAENLKTQGRKGCKAVRINMAFTPANYDYVRVMARVTGTTMTEFTNKAIEAYRMEHSDLYAQAQAIINGLQPTESDPAAGADTGSESE